MICPRCHSGNVYVQAVTELKRKHCGCLYWLCFGWLIELLCWLFFTLPMLLIALFGGRRYTSRTHSEAVCQNCGKRWRV